MLEFIKYQDQSQYPKNDFPDLSNYFSTLRDLLKKAENIPTVLAVVGVFPIKPHNKIPQSLTFYAFSTSETAYGAIKELAYIFGDFYGKTNILPCIDPILLSDLNQDSKIKPSLRRKLKTRGAVLFHAA
ncbi:MAG: hypothetical protein LH649_11440 [Pseudanabaena sp. CAN_BIN31]|nr:hypothetical protein [Pseudanabaena sp. CAN_BIN31]